MTILTIVLILIILILGYIIFNLNRKFNKLENLLDLREQSIILLRDHLQNSLDKILEVDAKGAFQSDDEVGWFFNLLKNEIETLNNNIIEITNLGIDE